MSEEQMAEDLIGVMGAMWVMGLCVVLSLFPFFVCWWLFRINRELRRLNQFFSGRRVEFNQTEQYEN